MNIKMKEISDSLDVSIATVSRALSGKADTVSAETRNAVATLDNINFEVYPAEVVGLVGDNGAGKSTLIRIVTGIHTPTTGHVYFEGQKIESFSPNKAIEMGIETVRQAFGLLPSLNIPRNIFFEEEPIKKVGMLSGGQQQAIKIGRAIYFNAKLVILDEPILNQCYRIVILEGGTKMGEFERKNTTIDEIENIIRRGEKCNDIG